MPEKTQEAPLGDLVKIGMDPLQEAGMNLSSVGIEFSSDIDKETWIKAGQLLGSISGTMTRGLNFALGDWANAGRDSFGDEADELLTVCLSEIESSTLRGYARVARAFAMKDRSTDVPWSTYKELSSVEDPKERMKLLKAFAKKTTPIVQVRAMIKGLKKPVEKPEKPSWSEGNFGAKQDAQEAAVALAEALEEDETEYVESVGSNRVIEVDKNLEYVGLEEGAMAHLETLRQYTQRIGIDRTDSELLELAMAGYIDYNDIV